MDISNFNSTEAQLNAEDELVPYNVPDYKGELDNAKTFLQKVSPYSGDNMYDHLSDCLNKILAERPENVIDFFEEYSRKVKEQRYQPLTDHLKDIYVCPIRFEHMLKIYPYLKPLKAEEEPSTADPEDERSVDPNTRDLILFNFYYEKAGIGLPKTELYCLEISMRNLAKAEKLVDLRFWGKIFGLYKNYIIVEAELSAEEIIKRNTPYEEDEDALQSTQIDELETALKEVERFQQEHGEGEAEAEKKKYPRPLPPKPISLWKPPPETPREVCGEGVNKKTYYICHEVGDQWIQLPDVTPQQIVAARQIVRTFTGNLDSEVTSYPKFPGNESNYLRAQIARISAGTQISPLGYFTFGSGGGEGGEEEEEEEEVGEEEEGGGDGGKTSYQINKRYEPHPMSDLIEPTMSFWVHHAQYILPQGRTKWWNPVPKIAGLGEEEDEEMPEEEEEEAGGGVGDVVKVEPETGPSLLTPCSEDASLEAVPAWSARCSSALFPEHAVAIIKSNLWPGAYAVTTSKWFGNIYLGTGRKHFATNFSPTPLPYIEEEYPLGPEIMETLDPTAEEEEAWRIAHLPKEKEKQAGEGEEEEAEEEEEEEEEDDDDEEE